MKATLTFDLPEEADLHDAALKGQRWEAVVSELDQWLRNKIKHEDMAQYQAVRDYLHECLSDEGLTLE